MKINEVNENGAVVELGEWEMELLSDIFFSHIDLDFIEKHYAPENSEEMLDHGETLETISQEDLTRITAEYESIKKAYLEGNKIRFYLEAFKAQKTVKPDQVVKSGPELEAWVKDRIEAEIKSNKEYEELKRQDE